MKLILLTLLLIIPTLSFSNSGDSVDVNLTSWHSSNSYNYNSNNLGIGYTKKINHHYAVSAGYFKNSYDKDSLYLFGTVIHKQKHWGWGFKAGWVTGYDDIAKSGVVTTRKYSRDDDDDDFSYSKKRRRYVETTVTTDNGLVNRNKYQFVIIPTIRAIYNKHHSMDFGYIPALGQDTVSIVTAQYSCTF